MVPVAVSDPAKPTKVLAAKPSLRRFHPNEVRVCDRFIVGIFGVVSAAVLVTMRARETLSGSPSGRSTIHSNFGASFCVTGTV
jgi:hypothetical protein